jgi:LPS-assembly protein
VIGRRYVNNIIAAANSPVDQDSPANSQTGIFFQLEFKGLTGIGEKLDNFFAQSIYGYRKSEE